MVDGGAGGGGFKESVAFKFTNKQISVGRSHTRAHSRAVFLKVVFGILELNVKLFMVRIVRMRSQMVSVGIRLLVRF